MKFLKRPDSLLYLLVLLNCNGPTRTVIDKQPERQEALKQFVSKFKEISSDTIKVISSLNYNADQYSFKGVLLDSADIKLLPAEFSKTYRSDKNFYACFKFAIDDSHTGLIVRTPSIYTPSSLKLFVLNIEQNKVLTEYIELAETVIQLVEYWDKKTYIVRDKKSPTTFLMWEHQNEDTTEIFYQIRFRDNKFDTLNVVQK